MNEKPTYGTPSGSSQEVVGAALGQKMSMYMAKELMQQIQLPILMSKDTNQIPCQARH